MLQVWSTSIFLVSFARWLDFLFRGHPVLLLYFVVLACPLGMNLIQVSHTAGNTLHPA